MPEPAYRKRKFKQEEADKFWETYTRVLTDSISETEKEGLENGYSSYQIERLWQEKTIQSAQKKSEDEKKRIGEKKDLENSGT